MTEPWIHATAVIDPGAQIGKGTRIWHFVHVSEGAVIGPRSTLGQGVYVGPGVRIGAAAKVQNHVSIFEGVEIGDEVFLGPHCVFTNVKRPRAFRDQKQQFSRTVVGRGATVGANATILCGNDLGAYSFVAAGAVVTRDVPAHALVQGTPARQVGWVCRCGADLPRAVDGRSHLMNEMATKCGGEAIEHTTGLRRRTSRLAPSGREVGSAKGVHEMASGVRCDACGAGYELTASECRAVSPGAEESSP